MNDEQVALWRRTLTLITEHPEVHNQGEWLRETGWVGGTSESRPVVVDDARPWACGTVGCLAGNAVLLSGRYPLRIQPHGGHVDVLSRGVWSLLERVAGELARDLLGLTDDQAEYAFDAWRTLVDLWVVAERVTEGRVTPNQVAPELRTWTPAKLAYARDELDDYLDVWDGEDE